MIKLALFCVFLRLSLCHIFIRVEAFSGIVRIDRPLHKSLASAKPLDHGNVDDGDTIIQDYGFEDNTVSRRAAIQNTAVIASVLASSLPASAYPGEVITSTEVDLDCLKDLPPVSEGCIRLYLCRHGQTENNRLRIVQGARVDPPVNVNGQAQAKNLGIALGRASPKPELFFSSSLLRARMTAEIAANSLDFVDTKGTTSASSGKRVMPRQLSSLAEIDFGPIADGQPISEVQKKIVETSTRWSIGDVDYRPDGGGDSGREVLIRASTALETLVNEAVAADVPCVVAVTHSAYLRVLVGMILNEPLIQSSVRKIRNGSVTVIDVPKDLQSRTIGAKPKLLGGWLSQKPRDFNLSIPLCKMIRINEVRHLPLDQI